MDSHLLTSKMALRAAGVTLGQMEEKTVLQTCLMCLLDWDSRDNKMSTITSTHSGSCSCWAMAAEVSVFICLSTKCLVLKFMFSCQYSGV